MQNSTTSNQRDTLNTQLNSDETHKPNYSKQILKRDKLYDTPFHVIETEEERFICVGDFRLTDNIGINTDPLAYINTNQWTITLQLISIIVERLDENIQKVLQHHKLI